PWPERDFLDVGKIEDLQIGIPKPAFLFLESGSDFFESGVAGRQNPFRIVVRSRGQSARQKRKRRKEKNRGTGQGGTTGYDANSLSHNHGGAAIGFGQGYKNRPTAPIASRQAPPEPRPSPRPPRYRRAKCAGRAPDAERSAAATAPRVPLPRNLLRDRPGALCLSRHFPPAAPPAAPR